MAEPGSGQGAAAALFRFVEDVASAATIDDLENTYLTSVGCFVPGFAAGLYILNPFTRGVESISARGVSDYFLSRYEEIGRFADPVLARSLAEGRPVDNRELMSADEWSALPVYGEVFRLHRMANLMEAPLVSQEGPIGTLNFGRSSEEGPFSTEDKLVAEAVARLLSVAIASIRARAAVERDRDQVVAALELCDQAVVVTDIGRAERSMNRAARLLLARLCDEDSIFDDLMTTPVRKGETIRCELAVRLTDGHPGLLTARSTTPAEDSAVVVSFLELATSSDGGDLPGLAAHDLTARERQVAELAANGLHDCEIAEQLYLSTYTVKQYLKTVYSKVGVRSRVDLTRMAHRRWDASLLEARGSDGDG